MATPSGCELAVVRSPPDAGHFETQVELHAGSERIVVVAATDVGRNRSVNDDAFAVVPEHGLAVVVDGMGVGIAHAMGFHYTGVIAARTAIDAILAEVAASGAPIHACSTPPERAETEARLVAAVRAADRAIQDAVKKEPALLGMGATVVAVIFTPGAVTVAHVGQCRAYLGRGSSSIAMTRDHVLTNEMRNAGQPEFEVVASPYRNIVTRMLGGAHGEGELQVDVDTRPFALGDRVVLCSQGIHQAIGEDGCSPFELDPLIAGVPSWKGVDAVMDVAVARGNDNATLVIAATGDVANASDTRCGCRFIPWRQEEPLPGRCRRKAVSQDRMCGYCDDSMFHRHCVVCGTPIQRFLETQAVRCDRHR